MVNSDARFIAAVGGEGRPGWQALRLLLLLLLLLLLRFPGQRQHQLITLLDGLLRQPTLCSRGSRADECLAQKPPGGRISF